jgi:hypothetical protein
MKLKDVRERIIKFFNLVDPDELYESALKHGMKEISKQKDEIYKNFKESLDNMSDEEFKQLLDEMENDPNGEGITVGEFFDKLKIEDEHNYVGRIVKYWDKNEDRNYTFLITGYDEYDNYYFVNNNLIPAKHIFPHEDGYLHIFEYEVII